MSVGSLSGFVHWRRLAVFAPVLLLFGCATPPEPLYYWGGYEEQVWNHFSDKVGVEEQILAMEESREKARAEGKTLPPGFYAHLGLLYVKSGKMGQVQENFTVEKQHFPESSGYMDFLLRNFSNKEAE